MTSSRSYEAKTLEDFLLERHDLVEHTKTQYRMAFQALAKYATHPFSLSRKEMNEALGRLAADYKEASWNAYVNCMHASTAIPTHARRCIRFSSRMA